MAANTKIEWTDATVNFWWGCTKVGPGCDHCYAESFDKRCGGSHWGLGAERRKIKGAVALIHRLDNAYADWAADAECAIGNARVFCLPVPNVGNRRRVFIQSMSDLFDLEVPIEWFEEAWSTIKICNRLDVQIVTKRVSVVEKRLAEIGCTSWPRHVGMMISVVNQAEADRDIPRLLALKAKFNIPWVGLSIEPMLGPIDLTEITSGEGVMDALNPTPWSKEIDCWRGSSDQWEEEFLDWIGLTAIPDPITHMHPVVDWVICGGESGRNARPMHPAWARSLRDQCAAAGVPFFFKQWGGWAPGSLNGDWMIVSKDGDIDAPDYRSPAEEFGETAMTRICKKNAGRLLDGRTHDQFPKFEKVMT